MRRCAQIERPSIDQCDLAVSVRIWARLDVVRAAMRSAARAEWQSRTAAVCAARACAEPTAAPVHPSPVRGSAPTRPPLHGVRRAVHATMRGGRRGSRPFTAAAVWCLDRVAAGAGDRSPARGTQSRGCLRPCRRSTFVPFAGQGSRRLVRIGTASACRPHDDARRSRGSRPFTAAAWRVDRVAAGDGDSSPSPRDAAASSSSVPSIDLFPARVSARCAAFVTHVAERTDGSHSCAGRRAVPARERGRRRPQRHRCRPSGCVARTARAARRRSPRLCRWWRAGPERAFAVPKWGSRTRRRGRAGRTVHAPRSRRSALPAASSRENRPRSDVCDGSPASSGYGGAARVG